ncbi:hypothetical protein N7468_004852 [Penicillium chermesinum]|uniref:DUF676 domain-containing protein n=1 Tax=Penicillium chermesinum TaxID=63820 RepID=A0A9W9TTM7_9EURO|nr:uncharacterized protein N7468_004852 [Penicillium chermesinum]KAJ5240233.1 hypothetical protein N7468_004852 [Penicillium chermesinum]
MSTRPTTAPSRSAWFERIEAAPKTDVDIVAIPPIGAHHEKIWMQRKEEPSWLRVEVLKFMPQARVLLYNHGPVHDHDNLETLGARLLKTLLNERKNESSRRPLFFVCHSTGGLVAKSCLVQASRADPNEAVYTSCYGIAFLATPHQGSSYLSAEEYGPSITQLFHLEQEIPCSLRDQLRPRQDKLRYLTNQFKAISSDMRVWSFLETVDSVLTVTDPEFGSLIEFHAPITSIKSGLLDIEHENEVPMATDHVGTASFQGQESFRNNFLQDLTASALKAVELSERTDTYLNVDQEVIIQINGFFEDTALGVSDESPLKLWSTRVTLDKYLGSGPKACLKERLKRHQHHDFDYEKDPRLSRPSLRENPNFTVNGPHSPQIHVTEAARDDYFARPSSESPPPPVERRRKKSIAKVLGLASRSHKRNASDTGSEGSSRPPSDSLSPPRLSGFLSIPASTRDRINQFAEAPDVPRPAPRFDHPEPGTEKLLWIHVPYTHTAWVSQVLRRACYDRHDTDFMAKFINQEHWYGNLIRARHLEPHARYVRPQCIHSRQLDISQGTHEVMPEDPRMALYVPYLHWDTYRNVIQRRKVVEDRLRQGRSRPVPNRIAKSSLEAQLIWEYLGSEPPIHFRRTLDQFGYPNLRSTVARDDDQMLWKRTRRPARLDDQLREYLEAANDDPDGEEEPTEFMDGNVLMVDQLWLWIVDQKTVVTFFPNQEATTSEGKLFEQSNLFSSVYNELNGDLARRFETAGDLAALIMLHAVSVLLDKTLHHDLQVLRIFEESISILTEYVTKSFKRFRNRGFANSPTDVDRTLDGKLMTAAQREQRERHVARMNRDDLSVMLELRDIEDEISTIMKLLEQQDAVLKSMMKHFVEQGFGKVFLDSAQLRIDEYRNQLSDMKENSHVAQKAVETLLDLKQKQANVDEAKMARWEAEETQNQGRSLMVFTIFTVIFLPLSFFTSLFGINAREWSGEPTNPTLGTMFEIAAPSSFAIIAVALLLAFSETLREGVLKSQKIGSGLLKEFCLDPIGRSLKLKSVKDRIPSSVVPEDSKMRERFDRYLGYQSHRERFEEDFWKRRDWKQSPAMDIGHHKQLGPKLDSEELLVKLQKSEYVV